MIQASADGVRPPALWVDVVPLMGLKLALGAYVLRSGFSHVSDDDYARTVIAQTFAHAPRLDPSGTSWLPMPFWIEGACMLVFGRSLAVARSVAIALGTLSVAAPYAAMRTASVPRSTAWIATAAAMALPWNAWLGVATVPEAWTGALVAAAVVAMPQEEARLGASAALLVAALSRYDAWPACLVCAVLCLVRRRQEPAGGPRRLRDVACAGLVLAGPLAWLAWNAYAHGDALHFVTRVTNFRRAVGAAGQSLSDKLLDYPRALITDTPEVTVLGGVGALGLALSAPLRRRWGWPAIAAMAVVAFLVYGDVRDGAPTHHPSRALNALWWLGIGMGIDALVAAISAVRERAAVGGRVAHFGCAVTALAYCALLPARWAAAPGNTDSERRDAQLARGESMRIRHVREAEITPCAFEHFALLAAWGSPESARIRPSLKWPVTSDCPHVVEIE